MFLDNIEYQTAIPPVVLENFVDSFWALTNYSDQPKDIIILPDGRIDILFSYSDSAPFQAMLAGLETHTSYLEIPAKSTIFAVSFRLLAMEYLLNFRVSECLNQHTVLPKEYLNMAKMDLESFESACEKISKQLTKLIPAKIDPRKQKVIDMVYQSNGKISVQNIADTAHWSSRQINRYFSQWYGLSLKAYCNILRFRACLHELKEGNLFPNSDFSDQAHFIKEIKKYSQHTPKQLFKNIDDRFLQLSVIS